MSTYPLLQIKPGPSAREGKAYNHGLPLTIDPVYIDNRNAYSGDDGSQNDAIITNAHVTSMAATSASISRRPSVVLDQTPPPYLSAPSSASSSFDYSSASGYLSPYCASTSASTCSSRRDSMIHVENTQHYTLPAAASPSPQTQDQRTVNLDQCFLPDSFANAQYLYGEPAILVEDDAQAYASYRNEPVMVDCNNSQWLPHGAAPLGGPVSYCKGLTESSMPEYLNLGLYTNLGQACQPSEMDHAQEQQPMGHLNVHNPSEISNQECSRRPSLDEPFEYRSRSPSPRWSKREYWTSVGGSGISQGRHRQKRHFDGISKPQRRTEARTVRDAGTCWLEEKAPMRSQKEKTHWCLPCTMSFARPEHYNRHMRSHDPDAPYVHCPLCNRQIKIRKDNLKAHVLNTHFKPSEKKKTEKMNPRWTMKDLFELFQRPLDEDKEALWMDFFQKQSITGSLEEIWNLVRGIDPRFARLLANEMTIHDRERLKDDKPGECTGKLTKLWTMLGWSIAEAQAITVKEIAPDWEGPAHTTLWDLDARRKALEDGTLKVEDAECLGVDMFQSRAMGLESVDPRWRALHAGEMKLDESERHGVKHLNAQWTLSQSKRKRSDR
ncbi:MAG: hypothetical protein Q9217_003175 [Psora testacea]